MKLIQRAAGIFLAVFSLGLSANALRAQVFVEGLATDAGQTLPTADSTAVVAAGVPLTTIVGTFGTATDADLFAIQITSTGTFSATTNNAATTASGVDTALFLFNANGMAIATNDDAAGGTTLNSTLPAGNVLYASLAAGTYYLGVSTSGNEPINSVSQLLLAAYPGGDTTAVRGAAVETNPTTEANFNGNSFDTTTAGAYEIDLTGAATAFNPLLVPEPATWALLALGGAIAILACWGRRFHKSGQFLQATAVMLINGLAFAGFGSLNAATIPENLGNGLDKLVKSHLVIAEAKAQGKELPNTVEFNGKKYLDEVTAAFASHSIIDEKGRQLVRITFNGRAKYEETREHMRTSASSLTITAEDKKYRGVGVLNAWVDVADVPKLAYTKGVAAVILELKPRHGKINLEQALKVEGPKATVGEQITKLGTSFDQGVTQHRVDQINQFYNPGATVDWEGTGMQVACLSDSFTAQTAHPASTDVTNYDLPGSSTDPVGNTTPVYVLQDDTATADGGTDEGRAMCIIVHKMAPKAAIAFASGDFGEVGFANNIRGLAGIAGYTNGGQTFAADTICDDLGYYDEPFFQDGIIAQGIIDAAGVGVSYFSSAGNDPDINAYESQLRWVANGTGLTAAAGNTALANTNINLANVPANLYAGGFHNFNPSGGPNVAQLVNIARNSSVLTEFQWNEVYDETTAPNVVGAALFTGGGTISSATPVTTPIAASLTAGTIYQLDEVTTSGTLDGIVTITDPNGTVIATQNNTYNDTGTLSLNEFVNFQATVTGTGYTVSVGEAPTVAGTATTGNYSLNLYATTGYTGATVQTQISLLVFDTLGNYLPNSSLTTNALATNQPIQLGYTNYATASGSTKLVQYVVARANVPTPGPTVATEFRYDVSTDGTTTYGPNTFFSYNTATTSGHEMSNACNGMAAYSVFRPSLPEYYSSPGPVTVYFDTNDNPLSTPDIRLQPRLAAADAANLSTNMGYFSGDSGSDPDGNGNFSGTSASGPHAAAIAALVLQAHGGPRKITPAQMTSLLERSTYPHDLDPNFSQGSAKVSTGGKVTITIASDNSTAPTSGENDPNAFAVNYIGSSSVTGLVFNPGGTAATGGNVSGGNNGVTYPTTSSSTVGGVTTYFSNSLPGVAFFPSTKAFTLGTGVTGAVATYTNLSGSTNQYYTMTITIPAGNLSGGNILHFTVGRGYARSSSTGSVANAVTSATTGSAYYCADIFGGGEILPDGTVGTGMTFSGTTADGGTFTGKIRNNVGSGYSVLDGFGFINAQAAVGATVQ
jgi:hypothetical protein